MRLVFVPSAPFLLPGLGGGPPDLRAAIDAAVATLEGSVTVLGAGDVDGPVTGSVDATPWGATGTPTTDPLPIALAVGSSLLGHRPQQLLGTTGSAHLLSGAVLVVGDGTAMRTEKAPGHFDPRAEGFDHAVDEALRSGDAEGLSSLDPLLGRDLWVGGLAVWRTVGLSAPGPWRGEVTWSGSPYGVHYVVASWS